MRAIIENRVVKSAVQDLHIPEVDVGTFIREAWEKFPERTAIVSTVSSLPKAFIRFAGAFPLVSFLDCIHVVRWG